MQRFYRIGLNSWGINFLLSHVVQADLPLPQISISILSWIEMKKKYNSGVGNWRCSASLELKFTGPVRYSVERLFNLTGKRKSRASNYSCSGCPLRNAAAALKVKAPEKEEGLRFCNASKKSISNVAKDSSRKQPTNSRLQVENVLQERSQEETRMIKDLLSVYDS